MGELTLWEKIVAFLWKPYLWTQCKAIDDGFYCVRRSWHLGSHHDCHGRKF